MLLIYFSNDSINTKKITQRFYIKFNIHPDKNKKYIYIMNQNEPESNF